VASDIAADEIDIANAMAAQAANALEKAQLYEVERSRTRRLEEMDTLRREFLATVSHELRTPLTGIIGFAETLTHYWDQMPNERRLSSVRKMQRSAQRLDRLVRDILLASQLEDATFSLRMGVVDASAIMKQAVDEIRAKYPGQAVEFMAPQHDLTAIADGERLVQVLVNLLDNAVKYSTEGHPVEACVETSGAFARFWVHDEGPGISAEQLGRLFSRFARLGHTPRKGLGGTGLGLYICQHLVRAMGGEVTVKSVVGQGSTFEFSLRMAPAGAAQ
jgi:signal transduction histidine kinase